MLNLPRLFASRAANFIACLFLSLSCAAFGAEPEISIAVEKQGDAFVVDATIDFPAPLRTTWEVLTDFNNMAEILNNVNVSKIISRAGNTLRVQQEGSAKFGIFSYAFASEREIRLEPMKQILARQLSGNAKRFTSRMELSETGSGTQGRYRAEIIPDSGLGRLFGGPFIKHEIEEQLIAMSTEMQRRKKP